MRLIVAGPPKTGNVWLKSLLADVYDLGLLRDIPGIPLDELQQFLDAGQFPHGAIFHQHFRPCEGLFRLVGEHRIRLITALRHPYDVFVSLFYYVQSFSHLFTPGAQLHVLVGKPIDHPAVLDFLSRGDDGFGLQITLAQRWLGNAERTVLTRYEALADDPLAELTRITGELLPVASSRLRGAVERCRADRMRRQSPTLSRHIRKGTAGDWRNHLSDRHLEVLNLHHGGRIQTLGYPLESSGSRRS
jgi:Sulfotransferase domain